MAAKSLCTFLKSPTCCLREILLAKADIDDGETAIVMEVCVVHAMIVIDATKKRRAQAGDKGRSLKAQVPKGAAPNRKVLISYSVYFEVFRFRELK